MGCPAGWCRSIPTHPRRCSHPAGCSFKSVNYSVLHHRPSCVTYIHLTGDWPSIPDTLKAGSLRLELQLLSVSTISLMVFSSCGGFITGTSCVSDLKSSHVTLTPLSHSSLPLPKLNLQKSKDFGTFCYCFSYIQLGREGGTS